MKKEKRKMLFFSFNLVWKGKRNRKKNIIYIVGSRFEAQAQKVWGLDPMSPKQ